MLKNYQRRNRNYIGAYWNLYLTNLELLKNMIK